MKKLDVEWLIGARQYILRISEKVNTINALYFSAGISAIFIGALFTSIYFIDQDFQSRALGSDQKSSQLLEIYSLDTEEIVLPDQYKDNEKQLVIHIIDIKSESITPSLVYVKVGETVQFNNLTSFDISIESVIGQDLKLSIPQGTSISTALYDTGIFYYKLSDDRIGKIFVE